MTPSVLMVVCDIFRFADGRTVITGSVEPADRLIGKCEVQLLLDGKELATLTIEGEGIHDPNPTGLRSLLTRDVVTITKRDIESGSCVLARIGGRSSVRTG